MSQTVDVVLPPTVCRHLGVHLAVFYADQLPASSTQPFEAVLLRLDRALRFAADADGQAFQRGLVAARPKLVARALRLVRNPIAAEDLVQETLLRAWHYRHQFSTGTNLEAWMFTILRNQCMSYYRAKQREVEDVDDQHAHALTTLPNQELRLTLKDLEQALYRLPTPMREAFVRVALDGMSHEDVAAQMGCRVGTVKSRVSRARAHLEAALEGWRDRRDREAFVAL